MKVALTGGICSGKSTVSAVFRDRGWSVFSLDDVARGHYSDPRISEDLRSFFGNDIYLPDGSLDRRKLASIVFSDPEKLKALDSIFLPLFKNFIETLEGDYILVEGAVIGKSLPSELREYDLLPLFDYVVFVERPLSKQIECVMKRYSLSRDEALKRIKSQRLHEVKAVADFLIMNHFSVDELLSVSSFLADFLKRVG